MICTMELVLNGIHHLFLIKVKNNTVILNNKKQVSNWKKYFFTGVDENINRLHWGQKDFSFFHLGIIKIGKVSIFDQVDKIIELCSTAKQALIANNYSTT